MTTARLVSKRPSEQNGVLAILRLTLGAGVTPAQGSVKPTEGFTFNEVIYPSPSRSIANCVASDAIIASTSSRESAEK